MRQQNVELPDETYFLLDDYHKKTGKSKKRIIKDALEAIFGKRGEK